MSIKTFVSEFQDYLFGKRSYLFSLDETNLSASNIELALKQTEELLEEFKGNVDFLEREGSTINDEFDEIFNSLEMKVDKISRFASALTDINSTSEDLNTILNVMPYQFDTKLTNWEAIQRCYILPPISSYQEIKPYSVTIDTVAKKGVAKYLVDDIFATKYLSVNKHINTNINNTVYYNSLRDVVSTSSLLPNIGKPNVLLTIPTSTRLITVEFTYTTNSDITVTPLSFYHLPVSTIQLPTQTYTYGSNLIFNIKSDIPFGCYAQIKHSLEFKDVNNKIIHTDINWHSVDNDGNVILLKEHVTTETILKVWKEGLFIDVTKTTIIAENDYVLCKPIYSENFKPITESTFATNVKHAKTVTVSSTLYLYSLLSTTSTPRIYSITGLSKK
jgi:hypothetical protein